jgi:hypothetical protein
MVENPQPLPPTFLTLQSGGEQSVLNLSELAAELARVRGKETSFRVLFDWSNVTSWRAQTPRADVAQIWSQTAPHVARAALVHDHRWTRQAALLAAVIRVTGGQVRSFHPRDYEKAINWLTDKLAPLNGPH